jgi:membrane protease YdiL (CAAX protease family)
MNRAILEIVLLLILPIFLGSFLHLETSDVVIFPFAIIILFRIVQLFFRGDIVKEHDLQTKHNIGHAFVAYLTITVAGVVVIYLLRDTVPLPYWLTTEQLWTFTLLHAFLQELIFRTYLLNRLRSITTNNFAVSLLGAIIFAGAHLLLPFSLTVIILTFIGGFAWSSLHQKYTSLPLLTLSHFTLNWAIFVWF